MNRAQARIQQHIANLASPNLETASRAERYLIRYYGVRAFDQLVEACSDPNPCVRFRAVWALAYTHDSRAYETIVRLTDDEDERVRYDATIALGILGDVRAIEHLKQVWLLNDETRPAYSGMVKFRLQALPALAELLRHPDPDIRHPAVNVIGGLACETNDAGCIELLETCLDDPDPETRSDVEFWLSGGFAAK